MNHHRHQPLLARFLMMLVLTLSSLSALGQDIALLRVLTPQSGCALGSETVSVEAINYGVQLAAGTQFLGLYGLDSNGAQNQMFTLDTPWEPMSTRVLTFNVPGNFSASGDHTLMVSINLSGDPNNGNNALHAVMNRSSANSVAGTLSRTGTGASGSLQLSGQTGSILQWEQSPDSYRWYKLANTEPTQDFANLDRPTQFRVRVANERCPAVTSVPLQVNP